jgi:hypothetical protein
MFAILVDNEQLVEVVKRLGQDAIVALTFLPDTEEIEEKKVSKTPAQNRQVKVRATRKRSIRRIAGKTAWEVIRDAAIASGDAVITTTQAKQWVRKAGYHADNAYGSLGVLVKKGLLVRAAHSKYAVIHSQGPEKATDS